MPTLQYQSQVNKFFRTNEDSRQASCLLGGLPTRRPGEQEAQQVVEPILQTCYSSQLKREYRT